MFPHHGAVHARWMRRRSVLDRHIVLERSPFDVAKVFGNP